MNIAFAAAEFFHMMAGMEEEHVLVGIVSKMADFSRDGDIIGAYGPRLIPGLDYSIGHLLKDPDTRQAIIPIFNVHDHEDVDGIMPCTLTIQLLNRERRLHAIANMRSNDAVWGLTYDVFSFTMLQEIAALSLGLTLGEYRHNDGSLHIYVDRDKEIIKSLSTDRYSLKMGAIETIPDWQYVYFIVKDAMNLSTRSFWAKAEALDPIIRDLLLTIRFWFARKAKDEPEMRVSFEEIRDLAVKKVMSLWR
jgi:thymidylate synthase